MNERKNENCLYSLLRATEVIVPTALGTMISTPRERPDNSA